MATVTLATLQNVRKELVNSRYYLNIRSGYMAPVTLHCSYGDSGETVTFYIFDGGDELTLTGSTVSLHGTRKDGASYGPIACTVSGNSVSFKLTSAMTGAEGGGIAEFTISKNSTTIGTCNFGVMVEDAVFPNGVSYDSDPSVYQDILKYVQSTSSGIVSTLTSLVEEEANTRYASDKAIGTRIEQTNGRIDNILTTDITQDDEIIDARYGIDGKTYGSLGDRIDTEIRGISRQLNWGIFEKRVVKNSYVTNAGVITAYNGWDRTDYILVEGLYSIIVNATEASTYNVFYDSASQYIGGYDPSTKTNLQSISISVGRNEVVIPSNAKWVIFSGTAAYTEGLTIRPGKRRADVKLTNYRTVMSKGVSDKQFIYFDDADFRLGYRMDSDGNTVEDTSCALCNRYYKLEKAHLRYKFVMPAKFIVYAYYYRYNEDGTYTLLKWRGPFYNGSAMWPDSGTSHVGLYFQHVDGSRVVESTIEDFCMNSIIVEMGDMTHYLRVCTFNQALAYFTERSKEDTLVRRLNHLNFIGEYDPDILCAQEALGTYFGKEEYNLPVADIFRKKYQYDNQIGTQRRTWSKFNYYQNKKVMFQTQASEESGGGARFYGIQKIMFEGREIAIVNTHCSYRGDSDFEYARKAQFQELAQVLADNQYCIICGDFNAWSADEFDIFSAYHMANCSDWGVIDTWYVGGDYPAWPFKAIDNIITTTNIEIQRVVRGPYDLSNFSDHAPLIADLMII